jgi:hypothetical protein
LSSRKKTREDLLRELKEKRQKGGITATVATVLSKTAEEEARLLEDAKKAGKFKPIGFRPIGADEKGKRKKNVKENRTRKKRKVDGQEEVLAKKPADGDDKVKGEMLPPPPPLPTKMIPPKSSSSMVNAEAEPADLDIFAGAGEYEGIDLGDDDDEDNDESKIHEDRRLPANHEGTSEASHGKGWFAVEESEFNAQPATSSSVPKPQLPEPTETDGEESGPEQPIRLVPLASSALPSIKDFLAMDKAADEQHKRRKRKDKKGSGGGDGDKANAKVKADRDYKRLASTSIF